MIARDTVFNRRMAAVFTDEPANVLRRLRAGYSPEWVRVCIGETMQIVTIPEYLYREKYDMVVLSLEELLKKRELPMYQRDPERFKRHIRKTAHQIIERILEGER